MNLRQSLRPVLTGAAIFLAATLRADVRLPTLFGNGMVLQRDAELRVWGWAAPGENISVALADRRGGTVAGPDGRWQVILPPMPASLAPLELTVQGRNTIRLDDVLIGEVWICAGQSNMEQALANVVQGRELAARAGDYPAIRLFKPPAATATVPLDDYPGARWAAAAADTVARFSAVGYCFGLELFQDLKIPVGLIQAARSGSGAQAWTSAEGLRDDFKYLLEEQAARVKAYPGIAGQCEKLLADYARRRDAALRERRPAPAETPAESEARWRNPAYFRHPAVLFNGMIAPLLPCAIRGVAWFQGEEDAPRAWRYRKLFPALIRDWRTRFRQGDFPFYYGQLANWEASRPLIYAELREAQLMALALTNTGMAVTIDLGDPHDVHFRNKREVGRRLALLALARTYRRDVVCSGPIYHAMCREGGAIRLTFKHADGGLTAHGGALRGFEIAGADRRFLPAQARIEEDDVIVWSEAAPEPVAVRYAWANNPACTLFNQAGLPASPFRTDDWPGITADLR